MIEYNDRTVYDWFDNSFPVDCASLALNIPPMPIYDSTLLNNRSYYTSDPLSDAVSVTSGNYVSTFTTPSDSPEVIFLNPDGTNTHHTIISDKSCRGRG